MISDDELLLYYYRDGLDGAERARIAAVLAGDPAVARRLHTLVARLDAAAALPEVPVPAQVQRRWQAALERATQAAGSEAARVVRTGPLPGARWLAAAAAVVAIAVVVTLQLSPPPQDRVTREAPPDATPATPSAYEREQRDQRDGNGMHDLIL
jgi:anti-sigma factor RsiW